MIYNNMSFVDTYNNANGKGAENLALSEFAKLLGTNKEVVLIALHDAGVRVPRGVSNSGIVKIIRKNRNNSNLKKSLGALVLANSDANSYSQFLGKKKDGTPRLSLKIFKKKNKDPDAPKKGNFFSRLFKKNEDGTSRAGNWYKKNEENITEIGSSLISGIGKGNNNESVVEGADYHSENNTSGSKPPMSMITKIGIGVGIIGIIAFVVYKMKKGKK
tara:strand:+ start:872 stop:1522 length:651 start_codon:yes stop_codon:yes gene_type:complete